MPIRNFWILLSIALLVSVCAHADPVQLRVGVAVPLSGSVAPMGIGFRKGLELYEGDHPEADRRVSFFVDDHKYDGKTSVTLLRRFAGLDKADLVVMWGNTPSNTTAPVAESEQIPLLAVSFDPAGKDRTYVMTFGPKMDRLVGKVVERFRKWNLKTPAAVSIDIGDAVQGIELMKKRLDGNLHVRMVANSEVDFKPIILSLRKMQADGIFLLTMPQQALTFMKQAQALGYHPRLVGGDVFAEEAFRVSVRQYPSEVAYVYGGVEQAFIDRVAQEFKDTSYFYETASAYAIAALLDRAARMLDSKDPKAILAALQQVDLSGLPVRELQLIDNAEYGAHFVAESALYDAKS